MTSGPADGTGAWGAHSPPTANVAPCPLSLRAGPSVLSHALFVCTPAAALVFL